MKIKFLGTAAAEGVPALFCECENCKKSRALGGKNLRSRSQAIVDDTILIDFPGDTYMHFILYGLPFDKLDTCIITHSHQDHLQTDDISLRKNGIFAHVTSAPLIFYGDQAVYDDIVEAKKKHDIKDSDVLVEKITPAIPFYRHGYKITPLRATHDPKTSPVVYIIEKGDKSLLYFHDSDYLSDEMTEVLKSHARPFSLVSFDCTDACLPKGYIGHMGLGQAIEFREKMISWGIADENTKFVLNHFSHNGLSVVYDEFSVIAEKEGFLTSYDGMEIEF